MLSASPKEVTFARENGLTHMEQPGIFPTGVLGGGGGQKPLPTWLISDSDIHLMDIDSAACSTTRNLFDTKERHGPFRWQPQSGVPGPLNLQERAEYLNKQSFLNKQS